MTNSQNTPLMMDRPLAAKVVRFVTGSYTAEMPAGGYSEMELQTLARKLSWLIDADVPWTALEHLVETIYELEELDRGIHHMHEVNPSGTVNNTLWLMDNIEGRIKEAVEYVLMVSRFHASYFDLLLAVA